MPNGAPPSRPFRHRSRPWRHRCSASSKRAFAATGYETAPVVRGVYLTSGTQAGSPIDRLLAELQRGFGLRVGPARALDGNRSFFLTRLLRDVVFAEAPLVRRASRIERRERRLAALAWGSAGCAILLSAGRLGLELPAADRRGARLRRIAAGLRRAGAIACSGSVRRRARGAAGVAGRGGAGRHRLRPARSASVCRRPDDCAPSARKPTATRWTGSSCRA